MRLRDTETAGWRVRVVLLSAMVGVAAWMISAMIFSHIAAPRNDYGDPRLQISPGNEMGPTPDISYLLADGGKWLSLNGDQKRELASMARKQDAAIKALEKRMEVVTRRTKEADSASPPRGGSSDDQAALLGEMPRTYKEIWRVRESGWKQAMAVLDPSQRRKVEARRRVDWREALHRLGVTGTEPGE